ncbi:uncharacterized protein HKW66_Vig0112180 [Vigna angularis]|uniref:Uncharacterized protein n=1 Tax=Phaseolus angularis TaxID=3914 RepID=A0A8T0KX20_PHAAN|nr:uncharacterized protein HKW66_Vig0112180 [Vigna angularis]
MEIEDGDFEEEAVIHSNGPVTHSNGGRNRFHIQLEFIPASALQPLTRFYGGVTDSRGHVIESTMCIGASNGVHAHVKE